MENMVADLEITGQGFMIDRVWFPYFELKAEADGQVARATFSVPRFNLSLETELEMKEPYFLSGLILVQELPLSALAGLLPEVEETSPLVALSASTRFLCLSAGRRKWRPSSSLRILILPDWRS